MGPASGSNSGNSLAALLLVAVVAALVFWGVWTWLKRSEHPAWRAPGQSQSHSLPVGGRLRDGVFHPGSSEQLRAYWLTAWRGRATVPRAESTSPSSLRMSSKL